jgi:hypothetical protein
MNMEQWWNDNDREIEGLREKPVPVLLFTRNITWTDLDMNPGLCCERPVTNHLSYGTANK